MSRKQKKVLIRILIAAALFAAAFAVPVHGIGKLCLFLIPYAVIGWDILWRAAVNIAHGQVFDENFLMALATLGAFATGSYEEGVAVMLFYQIGEWFQSCAVARSRRSIAALMDICPEYANVETQGGITQVDPAEVAVGTVILVKAGEKIPLDGVIAAGESSLDTSALTGESAPRSVRTGDTVISGCINREGLLRVRTTKPYDQSTVSKILELVENASERKAKSEDFITKFARWYTPCVVIVAVLLAVIPPLFMGAWAEWIHRALIFLVVSCPCALVISVPLSFFGGIGGASRAGILVKGGNYLEVLAQADTVVLDKTGTLTRGEFRVSGIHPVSIAPEELLDIAAHAEMYSTHPIARSIVEAYGKEPDSRRVAKTEEIAGHGVHAVVDGRDIYAGNPRLMEQSGASADPVTCGGTVVHLSAGPDYLGYIVISDGLKENAAEALSDLHKLGIRRTVMLTGDTKAAAQGIASSLEIDAVCAELLPGDKVSAVESMMEGERKGKLVFVGDGINDAPVLMRSDVGIAMGAMGSDAAIEAADVVLMDDNPAKIPLAIRMARRTMGIVYQNIVFALGVKGAILLLGALGYAGMWAAVFADVGVSVIAILNASRALRVPK
ncbi:MAG: cadmium-translocating P-type ATPase [Clostridia bacterium]|nr:cadmium-translocating P-type ATPase [Clostridia bacterium]